MIFLKYTAIIFVAMLLLLMYNYYPEQALPVDQKVDRLVLEKTERKLLVYSKDRLLKSYPVSLGFNPEGHKQQEGDGKTPEGIYIIHDKNPNSGYYLNLGINYPNTKDKAQAEKRGVSPGGDIKIHGIRNGLGLIGKLQRHYDWTHGFIALTNEEVQELYNQVPIGTTIEIRK